MHLRWSRKKIILQYLQIPPKIFQALSALHLESLITHSLNLKTCQHLQWSEANKPVLMEMEVSKVSVCISTLQAHWQESIKRTVMLMPCCDCASEAAWDLFLSMQLCTNALMCIAKQWGCPCIALLHVSTNMSRTLASAINYHVLYFSYLLSFFLSFLKTSHILLHLH